nr:type I restriction-modification protein subunit S [Mycoplasmopsis bovis]
MQSVNFVSKTNAWEQWKVGDLITERIEFTKESNEFPLMAFVANEGVVAKGERYDRSSLVRDIYNKIYKVTKYGDFIYSSNNLDRGSIGANKYGNACISPVYSIFKCTNSSDHNFIKNILSRHSFVNKLLKYRQGVVYGQLKIHESIFLNINLNSPSILEQNKIGKIFYNLDSLITLHQRKLLSLKNLKSRLLDRMFCDEKSQFPSIRFKEFTNTWEQWKVGDLITERIEFTKESNEFPLMAFVANEGVVAKGERYDRSSLVRDIYNKIYKVTKYGDFIYSSNNLDRGSIGANKYGNACISPVYSIFKCTNSSDHNFIKNILSRHSFVNKLLKYRQGVVYGQLKIHESIFLNINLNSPSILEQNKIGKIFYNLDSLITLHQRG